MHRRDTRVLRPGHGLPVKTIAREAAEAILAGELVAFPTETVYGLGANVFDRRAVNMLFRVKGRPTDNPLIVHIADVGGAELVAQRIPPYFETLAERFWPGPLTLVIPRNAMVDDAVTAGLPTVAVRVPAHELARAFLGAAGVPVAAPSANVAGGPSPTTAEHVLADLGGRIALVIDGGPCRIGIESTVLDLTRRTPTILRPGGVAAQDIEDTIGVHVAVASGAARRPASPGMKYRHYAPTTPVVLLVPRGSGADMMRRLQRLIRNGRTAGMRVGLLGAREFADLGADAFHPLGSGTPVEYAREMYNGLRALDTAGLDMIIVPGLPSVGLGAAVMNRLRKAAARIVR
ncbi:MAG: L-threonylcarbamoyladenylate synthase [Bacteroidota bacterium]|nr:L-threonylcarbamoyladenylate synthase [Bacteroidota bacterium]